MAAIANDAPILVNQDTTMVNNMDSDAFDHHAYWDFVSNENGERFLSKGQ